MPLAEADVPRRTAEMHAMIEAPAAVGPRHWRGRLGRRHAQRWAGELIERVRADAVPAPEGSALAVVAGHRDERGLPLPAPDRRCGAAERCAPPSRWTGTWSSPRWRCTTTRTGGTGCRATTPRPSSSCEVRRYYPFFPVAAARSAARSSGAGTRSRRPAGAARPVRHQPPPRPVA
ncbi:hypothetical protein V2I01_05095 [Micromonospora sp. BRA006-A]|nr:hypothetical protein [Micromonospora sp. BRA006-A]